MIIQKQTPVELEEITRQFVTHYVAMNPQEISMIAQCLVIRQFDKKEIITRPGEQEIYMNMVVKGLALKFIPASTKGQIHVVHVAKEGDFITNFEAFTTGKPSFSQIETIEPTTLLSVSRENLEDLYMRIPKCERLGRLVLTQQFLESEKWEFTMKMPKGRERFLRFVEEYPELHRRVPQKTLASLLNIKPETFSRLKHLLKGKSQ